MVIEPILFSGIDAIFSLFFALVALGLSAFSFRIYSLSGSRNAKFFGTGFLALSISYFILAIMDIFVLDGLVSNLNYLTQISPLTESFFAIMAFIASFTLGLSILAYTVVKVQKRSLFVLIFALSLIGIALSSDIAFSFFMITSVIFVFISASYFREYMFKRSKSVLLIFLAFLMLTLANIQFLFSTKNQMFYLTGNITGFIGYLLIFISLTLLMKNGQKEE